VDAAATVYLGWRRTTSRGAGTYHQALRVPRRCGSSLDRSSHDLCLAAWPRMGPSIGAFDKHPRRSQGVTDRRLAGQGLKRYPW
jgi:hypothetical protein